MALPTATQAPEPPKHRSFDPSKYSTRLIALKIAYLGRRYNGFEHHANNKTPLPTVEEVLWQALVKTCLIHPDGYTGDKPNTLSWDGCDYSKCGRTDKGVSAYGQVIGLRVRSNRPLPRRSSVNDRDGIPCDGSPDDHVGYEQLEGRGVEALDANVISNGEPLVTSTFEATSKSVTATEQAKGEAVFDDVKDELSYARMMNRVLPEDIRVLAWCPSPPSGFDARFSCKERHYKYFFTQPAFSPVPGRSGLYQHRDDSISRMGWLDIDAMKEAVAYFVGLHDFRNFCKIDSAKQITNFKRRIYHASIEEEDPANSAFGHLFEPNFMLHHNDGADRSPQAHNGDVITHERTNEEENKVIRIESRCPKIFSFTVHGSAFLWHQIRHLVAVLFLVGQGLEKPSVIKDLLDVQKTPRRPMYELAAAEPLVLYDCVFSEDSDGQGKGGLKWVFAGDEVDSEHKNRHGTVSAGMFGRSELAAQIWQLWHRTKVDEVLSAMMLRFAATNGLKTLTKRSVDDDKRSMKRYVANSCR